MYMITSDEAGVNFNSLEGLIDVNFTNLSVTATDVTFDATLDYGTAINKIKFKGALIADFDLTGDGLPVIISAVVENTDGNYTVSYTATAGDLMVLTLTKDGYIGSVPFTAV